MKKLIILFFIILFLSSVFFGCEIEITSSVEKPVPGQTVELTIRVLYEHRRCLINPEDTLFKAKNLQIIKQEEWKKIGSLAIEKKITVKILKANASLEVERTCSKKDLSSGIINFVPTANSASASKKQ